MTARNGGGNKEMARAPEGAAGQVWGGNASHTAGRGATPQPVRDDGVVAFPRLPKNAQKSDDLSLCRRRMREIRTDWLIFAHVRAY